MLRAYGFTYSIVHAKFIHCSRVLGHLYIDCSTYLVNEQGICFYTLGFEILKMYHKWIAYMLSPLHCCLFITLLAIQGHLVRVYLKEMLLLTNEGPIFSFRDLEG